MKKILLIAIAMLFVFVNARSEWELDFGGYVYNMSILMKTPDAAESFGIEIEDDYSPMNITRFRFYPSLNFSADTRITMHYEINMLLSELFMPNMTGGGKTNRQAVNLSKTFIDEDKLKARHFLDLLYLKHMFDFGEITFGRQIISWGSGRVWQPTDLFNPINPANYSKFEKDGADAISFKYYLGNFSDLEIVYNFRESFNKNNFAGRLRSNIWEYDISVMSGYFDDKIIFGGDFAGNFFDAGVRGEAIFSFDKDNTDSNFVRGILGIDYQFTAKLYAMIEYQFNGEGAVNKENYDIERLMKGEIQNVSRNYITGNINYQITPLITSTFNCTANISDGSFYTGISGQYSLSENINLGIGTMFFSGEKYEEYWYYSTAFYLLGQYYF